MAEVKAPSTRGRKKAATVEVAAPARRGRKPKAEAAVAEVKAPATRGRKKATAASGTPAQAAWPFPVGKRP